MNACVSLCVRACACTYMYEYVHAGVCICMRVHMFTCVWGIKGLRDSE